MAKWRFFIWKSLTEPSLFYKGTIISLSSQTSDFGVQPPDNQCELEVLESSGAFYTTGGLYYTPQGLHTTPQGPHEPQSSTFKFEPQSSTFKFEPQSSTFKFEPQSSTFKFKPQSPMSPCVVHSGCALTQPM